MGIFNQNIGEIKVNLNSGVDNSTASFIKLGSKLTTDAFKGKVTADFSKEVDKVIAARASRQFNGRTAQARINNLTADFSSRFPGFATDFRKDVALKTGGAGEASSALFGKDLDEKLQEASLKLIQQKGISLFGPEFNPQDPTDRKKLTDSIANSRDIQEQKDELTLRKQSVGELNKQTIALAVREYNNILLDFPADSGKLTAEQTVIRLTELDNAKRNVLTTAISFNPNVDIKSLEEQLNSTDSFIRSNINNRNLTKFIATVQEQRKVLDRKVFNDVFPNLSFLLNINDSPEAAGAVTKSLTNILTGDNPRATQLLLGRLPKEQADIASKLLENPSEKIIALRNAALAVYAPSSMLPTPATRVIAQDISSSIAREAEDPTSLSKANKQLVKNSSKINSDSPELTPAVFVNQEEISSFKNNSRNIIAQAEAALPALFTSAEFKFFELKANGDRLVVAPRVGLTAEESSLANGVLLKKASRVGDVILAPNETINSPFSIVNKINAILDKADIGGADLKFNTLRFISKNAEGITNILNNNDSPTSVSALAKGIEESIDSLKGIDPQDIINSAAKGIIQSGIAFFEGLGKIPAAIAGLGEGFPRATSKFNINIGPDLTKSVKDLNKLIHDTVKETPKKATEPIIRVDEEGNRIN